MKERQINIRGVPAEIGEWIERERHAKRVSKNRFLLKVLENAAAQSPETAPGAATAAFSKMTMIYWKSKKFWLGKLLEHPEIMTQGRTVQELERNIREAFMLMALDDVPGNYHVRQVTMA